MFYAFNLTMVAIAATLAAIGLPIHMLFALAVLMLIDYLFGIAAAWKTGEEISSKRMKAGIIAKVMVFSIPLIFSLMSYISGAEYEYIIAVTVIILALAEGYSILSHISNFISGEKLPELNAVTLLGKKLRGMVDGLISAK